MLHDLILVFILLMFLVWVFVMVGQKIKVPYPIALVIAGLLIGIFPGIPIIPIHPDIVFLLFLPPILFEAAWNTHWHSFWKFKWKISLFAFGLVIVNATIIAFASSSIIPGFTLALGFLLGGIISPPDAVAATSVFKHFKLPRNITTLLEGESLINDASSLIIVRFATIAVITGAFSFQEATLDFLLLTIMGVAIGLVIGAVLYLILRYLPTTPDIDTALTFIAPYILYMGAEHFHYSGVMSVVAGGLFLSFHSVNIMNHESRLQSHASWKTLIFIINGIIFILIGLQLPLIIENIQYYSFVEATLLGIAISIICIVIRLLWIFPSLEWLKRLQRERGSASFSLKEEIIIGWSGMRGVISLAAALNIPIYLSDGEAFPYRNLILYITFVVILVTLVFQGLTLPLLIKRLGVTASEQTKKDLEQETALKIRMSKLGLKILAEKYKSASNENPYVVNLRERFENRIHDSISYVASEQYSKESVNNREQYRAILIDILEQQRSDLLALRNLERWSDEEIRNQLNILDYEETLLINMIRTVETPDIELKTDT